MIYWCRNIAQLLYNNLAEAVFSDANCKYV